MKVKDGELVPAAGTGRSFLEGIVVDEAGKPVPGARVEAYAFPRGDIPAVPILHASATAGEDGRFRVGPGPSPWSAWGSLTAFAPGFARTCRPCRDAVGPGEDYVAEDRENRIVLRPGTRVTGVARTEKGSPPDGPVTIWAFGGRDHWEVVTSDAEGAFSFLAPQGMVSLNLMEGNHPLARSRFEVKGSAEVRTTLSLRTGRDIRGRVVDRESGAPVPGAVIRAYYGRSRILLADAQGRFLLPRYWFNAFQVVAPGYAGQRRILASDAGSEFAGEETVRLARGCVVRGTVTDLDGRPLAGIRLRTLDQDTQGDWVDILGTASRADGTYTFAGVPLAPAGREVRIFGTGPGLGFGASDPIRGTAGAVLDGMRLALPRLVPVEGRVEDEHGEPVSCLVSVSWELGAGLGPYAGKIPAAIPRVTGPDGRWSVEIPERTRVHASASGDAFATGSAESRTPVHPDSAGSGLRPDAGPLVVKVRRGLSIRGLAVDVAGRPVGRGEVRVEPSPPTDPRPSRDATIRPDGTFEAGGLEPGLYDISVLVHPGFLQEVVRGLRAGDPQVRVPLRRPGGILGRVLRPEGAPEGLAAEVAVRALGETHPLPPTMSIRTTPGDRPFSMAPLAPGPYSLTVLAGDWRLDRERIDVRQAEPTDLGDLRLERGAAIAGRVLLAGQPLAGAPLELIRLNPGGRGESLRRDRSGPDGGYHLGGLREGSYLLVVRAPGRPPREIPVEVKAGAESRFDAAVAQGGVLVVKAMDGAGNPVAGARVRISDASGGVPFWREGSADPGPHATGPGGVLRCAGVPAGAVRVAAESAGAGSGEVDATVADGAVATVEVRLSPR